MIILSSEDIRLWDQYTILHEPIASIDLMERAAVKCVEWIEKNFGNATFHIYCGKGNNGGDGLAIARQLANKGRTVAVSILEFGHKGSLDFQSNLARLHQVPGMDIRYIQSIDQFHNPGEDEVIIDALFGYGLNRPLEGISADLVRFLNGLGNEIISIDMPSGLFADRSSAGNTIIKATHTLSFQCYKPAFLFAENETYTGEITILDIGLDPNFPGTINMDYNWINSGLIRSIYKPRKKFAHKGNFGHAMLLVGSYGKTGAAVLAARACLRSGVGLVTCHIPASSYSILQTAVPEAMVSTDFNSSFNTKLTIDLKNFDALGIGPGLGTASETRKMLGEILEEVICPLVIDADALNILSIEKQFLENIPRHTILTPHPKEFDRIFGDSQSDFHRAALALEKAKELECIIVLKGRHTLVACPDGRSYFNITGNPGMATAGSGDVLTGILAGLLAQGYTPQNAAFLGVYLHGMAGDLAAAEISMESMTAGDIINYLGPAFLRSVN